MNPEIKNGLRELPPDDRDFKVGAIVDLPLLSELPADFVIGLPPVKDQKDTDMCGAAASCTVSELQEGVPLCFEWVFAVAKMIDGDLNGYGSDLRTECQVHQKYGAIEVADAPYSLEKGTDAAFMRRIENWPPDLFQKALAHKKGSYFSVEAADTDRFDTIRRTMWHFRNEKCGVIFGVLWAWAIQQVYIDTVPTAGSGHALPQIGWKTDPFLNEGVKTGPVMFIQNSYPTAGDNGRQYFSREVINAFADRFGCFMFHDLPAAQAKSLIDSGAKMSDNWLVQLCKTILTFLNGILKLKNAGSAAAGDTQHI